MFVRGWWVCFEGSGRSPNSHHPKPCHEQRLAGHQRRCPSCISRDPRAQPCPAPCRPVTSAEASGPWSESYPRTHVPSGGRECGLVPTVSSRDRGESSPTESRVPKAAFASKETAIPFEEEAAFAIRWTRCVEMSETYVRTRLRRFRDLEMDKLKVEPAFEKGRKITARPSGETSRPRSGPFSDFLLSAPQRSSILL